MTVNCDISCSASNDRYLAGRCQTQFYDTRQCYVDKLARRAFHECDWSSVTGAAEIDDAYNTFLAIVHRLIQQTIPCRKVTLTKYTPPYITPLVKSLLRRRNKLRRKGRIEAANKLSTKIGKLIADFRATQLQRLNSTDIRRLWATVKPSLGKSHKPISLCERYMATLSLTLTKLTNTLLILQQIRTTTQIKLPALNQPLLTKTQGIPPASMR